MPDRAVVLLSGGIDSAVCLWWLRPRAWEVHALTFNYPPAGHRREMEAARAIAESYGVTQHLEVELPFLRELGYLRLGPDHPLRGVADRAPPTYIPNRNMIFYSIAAHIAETLGARWIIGGHIREDANHFPDSAPAYLRRLNRLLAEGLIRAGGPPVRIVTPLARLEKKGVVELGSRLGVPFHLTWSCYGDGEKHCGRCLSCRARRAAFEALGLVDPAEYAE
jgi:7-cyano-7-deazaguanine synthase